MTDSQIEGDRLQAVRYARTLDELIATAQETRRARPTRESLQRTRTCAHMAIHVAHRLASDFLWNSRVRLAANSSLDVAVLRLYEGKWLLGRVDGTYQDFAEEEAKEMMLALPVGDPGPILRTAGGMFADPHDGFVIEERTGAPNAAHPIVRSATYDQHDRPHLFLYANNNPLDPDPGVWRSPRESNFRYSRDAGWHITRAEDAESTDPVTVAGRMATKNSAARNRYLYRRLMDVDGRIDLDAMRSIYGQRGVIPEGPWEDAVARWGPGRSGRRPPYTALMRSRR